MNQNQRNQDKEEESIVSTLLRAVMGQRRDTGVRQVNCWHCDTELIWGADHELEEEFYGKDHAYDFVSNLHCPKCQSYVEVFHRKDE